MSNDDGSTKREVPDLSPGYHFILSFCDTTCDQKLLEQIKEKMVRVARDTIREHNLRDADGSYIPTRVRLRRISSEPQDALPALKSGGQEGAEGTG
jgi:hypothetical protein